MAANIKSEILSFLSSGTRGQTSDFAKFFVADKVSLFVFDVDATVGSSQVKRRTNFCDELYFHLVDLSLTREKSSDTLHKKTPLCEGSQVKEEEQAKWHCAEEERQDCNDRRECISSPTWES